MLSSHVAPPHYHPMVSSHVIAHVIITCYHPMLSFQVFIPGFLLFIISSFHQILPSHCVTSCYLPMLSYHVLIPYNHTKSLSHVIPHSMLSSHLITASILIIAKKLSYSNRVVNWACLRKVNRYFFYSVFLLFNFLLF
jgi:hypothetical protein